MRERVWNVRHINNNHIIITPRTELNSSQEMAKHLKKDPQSLLFCLEQGGGKLTGKEMMGDLEGARIVVTRLSWTCAVMCFQPNTVSFVKPKISIICHLQFGNWHDLFPKPYEIWPCWWEVSQSKTQISSLCFQPYVTPHNASQAFCAPNTFGCFQLKYGSH